MPEDQGRPNDPKITAKTGWFGARIAPLKAGLGSIWTEFRSYGPAQIRFWFIALGVGIAAGFAALLFRKGIETVQAWAYRSDAGVNVLHTAADMLPWYWICAVPVIGGLVVGVILHLFTRDARIHGVAEVIEGAALDDGRVQVRPGLVSAACSFITLSTGGSSGREGPVVHIAGILATWVSNLTRADGITGRDLLGCACAAAVSASFNAPIAGAIFALEVILRHFAVHAFAPIVIASAAGTVINRLEFGDMTEFSLPDQMLEFFVELPAFLILGLVCGLVAVVLMRSIFWTDGLATHLQNRYNVPRYLRPAAAGLLLGLIAIPFPHIIGVGYETTSLALTGKLLLNEMVVFAILKVIAVAITLAGRMGGGVFSPSLMLGALVGLAFGVIATGVFPNVSGSQTLYALAGMGAVAAAVLGAPISTTLIVFELTGDWQTAVAVMLAVSMSTALASQLVDRSFFLTQLENRNVHLAAGPQAYLLALVRVATITKLVDQVPAATEDTCWELIGQGVYVDGAATLETAMPYFDQAGVEYLPVVTLWGEGRPPELLGVLTHVDALKAYNRALAETAREEHS